MREAARRTDGKISHSQLARIAHGQSARVRPGTLTALSSALGIPISKLRAANGSEPTARRPFVLPERANELNTAERRLIVNMVGALLAARERPRRAAAAAPELPVDIPGARPAAQVIESGAQADRARAAGMADEHLVTLMLARRALAGQGGMPPRADLVAAVSDPAADTYDQVLVARIKEHLRL